MDDIFLSYAREDVARAAPLVKVLEAERWSVFWDASILPGAEYRHVIDGKLDAARGVVVLWSRRSIASHWVRDEADKANARGVLIPVLIDDVRPPTGLGQLQAVNLVDWKGQPDAAEVTPLIRAIRQLLGGNGPIPESGRIRLRPVDLSLITGDKSEYPEIGPTVNMMCTLTNDAEDPVELRHLELIALQKGELVYRLAWHLFYDERQLGEHAKVKREPVVVPGKSTWKKGVQFRESRADIPNAWRVGPYEFELLGWTDRLPAHSAANLRTTFRGHVDAWIASQLRRWRDASRKEWTASGASNRAYGFPVTMQDIESGL